MKQFVVRRIEARIEKIKIRRILFFESEKRYMPNCWHIIITIILLLFYAKLRILFLKIYRDVLLDFLRLLLRIGKILVCHIIERTERCLMQQKSKSIDSKPR